MKYFLRQKTPNGNINAITIPLEEDNVRVGRKTVSQLSQYPQISREHAEFHRTTSGTLFVRDLNSSNGLYVNGKQVGTSLCEVNIGDIIGFGVPFLEDENGFVCILCSLCNPAVVKHEVILISDEEECSNNNRHSNPVPQTSVNESKITFPSPKCIKQDVTKSTSNCTSVNQAYKVPDTSSILKSSNSVLYMNSVSENYESEQDFEVRDTANHALTSSQINLNVLKDTLDIKLPVISLVRCDSEDFEWPKDVCNPCKKQKLEDLQNDSSPLKQKRKRIKKLSSESDSNEEMTFELSFDKNQNALPYNNASKNSILLSDFKKRKKSVKDFSSSKKQLKQDVSKSNFSYRSSESNLRNEIEEPITMTVVQKDMYEPLKSIDNEISYSQVEDVIIISDDDDTYLGFDSSQNSIHIKEEPTDTNEDMDNQDDLYRKIFEAESECGPRVETFVQSNAHHPESIESIRKFVEDTEQKSERVVNNEADHCDLEMHCSEESDSDDNFESEVFCTAKIPLELKEKNNDGSLDSKLNKGKTANKPVRRTLLTEAKPMQQRPYKIRGREEGFIERNQYHEPVQLSTTKKSEISRKSRKTPVKVQKNTSSAKQEVIKIDSMSSNLKNFKIPHKQKVQTAESHIDLKARNTSDSSQLNSSSSKKKAAPVKTRPEKFGSRMAFLVDNSEINPIKSKKSHETRNSPNQLRPDKRMSSDKKQINKSSLHSTSYDEKQRNKSNFPPTGSYEKQSNKSNFLPTSAKHNVLNDNSTNIVQQMPKSLTVSVNTRDPRINKLNSSSGQDVVKVKLPQASDRSAYVSHVKGTDRGESSAKQAKPTSETDFTVRGKTQLTSHVIINKLINLKCIWLQEQAKKRLPPLDVSKDAANLPLQFKSYNDYVNLFTPMIMLEIWDYMFTESKEVFKSNKTINKFYFSIISYEIKKDCVELKCESIVAEKLSYSPKEGSIVILELKNESNINPLFGYIFKHKIDKFDKNFLQSSVWQKLPKEWLADAKRWTYYVYIKKKEMSFRLGNLMKANSICYIRSKLRLADALGSLKNSPLVQDLIQPRRKTFFVSYTAASPTREYTSGQMKVINGIHTIIDKPNSEPKIILVQGPPGTGKTHTIIGLLERLIQKCNSFMKILMVAPSNAAIDEIGCRLIELNKQAKVRGGKLKFVRVGMEKQIHEKMIPYFLEQRVKDIHMQTLKSGSDWREKKLQDLKKNISQIDKRDPDHLSKEKCLIENYNALKEQAHKEQSQFKKLDYNTEISMKETILKESHIVLSTLNSCGLSILLRTFKLNSNMQFSCCIIDEATQCTELEVLQPLMFGINKLILVGDHMQLPATVTSKLAANYGFERSMFERFHMFFEKQGESPVYTLTEQFRMHSKICAFPSKYFYHRKLVTDPDIDIKYNLFPLNHYIILDVVNSQEIADSSSKVNHAEASVIASLCKCLLDVLDSATSVGIITPYQGQRSLYLEALHQNPNYRNIEINTIDGFQGREKDVIIFSCVRANSQSGGIGFLVSRNRLNVAITRAKKSLVIVCHAVSLCMYHDWRTLFDDAKERQSYIVVSSSDQIPVIFDRCIKKQIAQPFYRAR